MKDETRTRNFRLRDSAWLVSLCLSIGTLASLFLGAGVIVGRIQAGVLASDKIAADLKEYITRALLVTDQLSSDLKDLQLKVEGHHSAQREWEQQFGEHRKQDAEEFRRLENCCHGGRG